MDWLRLQIRRLRADVLLVAGDVFDSSNPGAEAQRLFYLFLREVTGENPGLQVIIIAGNHDSAARLEAPNPLLECLHVSVRGLVRRTQTGAIDYRHLIVPLRRGGCCLAVPYLRQGDYPEATTYAQGVKNLYATLYGMVRGGRGPILAMGHLQAAGSEVSESDVSERTFAGGLECVSSEAFDRGITYTALGHLHRAQRVAGRENVRYAGAPLPMSFAERNYARGVTYISIDGEKVTQQRLVFEAPVKLWSIPSEASSLEAALGAIAALPEGEADAASPYVEVKILLTEPEPSLRHRLEEALRTKAVRLARIEKALPGVGAEAGGAAVASLQGVHPMEIAEKAYRRRFAGLEMPPGMRTLLEEVIREVEL